MALFGATGGAEQSLTIVIKARNEAAAQLQKTQQQIEGFRAKNEEMLKSVAKWSGVATVAFGAMGVAAIKAAGDMEQTRVAFDTMLGSAERGGAFLKDLYDFAKRTPFTITSVEEAGKKLLAYNIQQQEVLPTLKTLGDLAAGVGTDKFPQLVLAYGQVRAAGKLFGTELRQFTETGIPLITALAEHFGVAEAEIRGMVERGEVGFNDVKVALGTLTEEGGKFENLMGKQAETLGGMVSNLQDSWTLFMRSQGQQFLEFAKVIVGGLTNIITRVQEWSEANPRLSSTLFGVAGGAVALTAAISGGLLILPKLISGVKSLSVALKFLALNPIGVVITAIGFLAYKFVQLADTVGGFERAWHIVVLKLEQVWLKYVQTVYKGINLIAQYIPGLNNAVAGTLDNVNAKLAESKANYDALITQGVNEVAAANNRMGEEGTAAFEDLTEGAGGFGSEMAEAAKKIAEVEKQVTDLQKAFLGDLIDAKRDYAETYVDQEEKVHQLRKDIRRLEKQEDSDANATRLRELRKQYDEEKRALENHAHIREQLSAEVEEAERRASLTDFERQLEDIARRQKARQEEFNEKMAALQAEIVAEQNKASQIRSAEQETTRVVSEEVNKREKDVISSVNRQIRAYENLAEASTLGKRSFSFDMATANSTPAYRGFATGGVVDGPIGSARLIMAHGGEKILPASRSNDEGGGNQVIVNFYQPRIDRRERIAELRTEMERAWRSVTRNTKMQTT